MNLYISYLILLFILCSVFGWGCEMIYCFAGSGRLINRGFLKGPYCPIYGIGALIIVLILTGNTVNPLLVFAVAVLVATILEYFASWLLELMFGICWWNYSKRRFNLNGRICLKNSLLFGVLGLALIYIVNPLVIEVLDGISHTTLIVLSSMPLAVILLDLLTTLGETQIFVERISGLQHKLNETKQESALSGKHDKITREGYLKEKLIEVTRDEFSKLENAKLEEALLEERFISRFAHAFPNLYFKNQQMSYEELAGQFEKWADELKQQRKERGKRIAEKFTGKSIKGMFASSREYTGHISIYKLFWIFVIACVLGYVVESLWCLVRNGYIESRQGFLYGPFSHVYGLGAIVMVILLSPLARKSDSWIFAGSAIVGGMFEWLCSWFQEIVFGTVSWEYSSNTLPIGGGRTCLTYMFFWGILGIVFIKRIYPKFSRLIDRILNARKGLVVTWILIIFLVADAGMSAAAVYRWSERDAGIEPSNVFEQFLDTNYPDELMENIYPNMVMKKSS